MQDVVIIGAGIVGCFLAHDLSMYDLKITVLDKENDVANQVTMANSAIIHTGYDPKEGTLKAKLNVEGARMYEKICQRLQVDYKKCGAFIAACSEEECKTLEELRRRALHRGIRAFYPDKETMRKEEPNLSDAVIQVLSVPDTAVIYPWQCAHALIEEAMLNGVELKLGCEVTALQDHGDYLSICTSEGVLHARVVINAAGCKAEAVASLLETAPFQITCRKGQYFVLSKKAQNFVHHIIYPVPNHLGKGVLAVPTTHGNVLIGPDSSPCDPDDLSTTAQGFDYVRAHAQRIVKNIPYGEVIRSYSGLRPSGNDHDFYIRPSAVNPRFIHAACIDSPGLASAPAISRYIIEHFVSEQVALNKKTDLRHRSAPKIMANLTTEEKNELIRRQPLYGRIVCKCENISYQEIVDAIHSPCGAKTIKAVKKRVRPGMGKCQGGFCEVEVAKILAEELHIPLADVLYDRDDSRLGAEAK